MACCVMLPLYCMSCCVVIMCCRCALHMYYVMLYRGVALTRCLSYCAVLRYDVMCCDALHCRIMRCVVMCYVGLHVMLYMVLCCVML